MAAPQKTTTPLGAQGGQASGTGQGGQGAIFGMQPFDFQPNVRSTLNYGFPNTRTGMQAQPEPNFPFQNPYTQPNIFDPATFADKNTPTARMLENTLPVAQFLQNQYQYSNDATEAQRRWLAQFEWQRQGDQFNMQLARNQQNAALAQAQQAQQNWAAQFGHQQGLDAWAQQFQQGRAQAADTQFGQRLALDTELGMGQLNLQRQIAGQGTWEQRAREALDRAQLAQQAQQFGQTFGLQQQIANRGSYEQQAQARYQQGLLSQQANELALQRLLGTGQLSLAQLTQRQQNEYQLRQLAQQAMLEREQMQNQQRLASMQAFGRAEAPTARFVQSWA